MSSERWTALSPSPSSFAVITGFVTDTGVHVKRFHSHAKISRWCDSDPTFHAFLMAGFGSVSGSFLEIEANGESFQISKPSFLDLNPTSPLQRRIASPSFPFT
jgi:hypothetical protein